MAGHQFLTASQDLFAGLKFEIAPGKKIYRLHTAVLSRFEVVNRPIEQFLSQLGDVATRCTSPEEGKQNRLTSKFSKSFGVCQFPVPL